MEEEENRQSPVREDPARGGEKPPSEPALDSDWDQSGALCVGQVIILKALQQAVDPGLAAELQDPANEKDAECKRTSRRKWCRSSKSEGPGRDELGSGDPALACDRNGLMGEVLDAPSSGVMPALAGVLDYLEWIYHLPQEVESPIGTQAVYEDEEMEEVELVAEVRLGDVSALSGIFRRNLSWRMQKSACLGSSAPCWRGSSTCPIGQPLLLEQPYLLDPHRTMPIVDKASWTSLLGRSKVSKVPKADRTSPSPCLGMTLGTGMGISSGGQQRPQSATGRESESQQRSQPPPSNSIDKADSSTSSSSSCSSSTSSMSRHQGLPGEGGSAGSSNPCPPMHSPDLDIYDPFHPTDEDNLNGDFGFGDSPNKDSEGGRHDQKYDPFDPTGSNPSSSVSTPSPEEEEDEDDDEEDDHDQNPPDMSHSISRISETLAGIYDENSLSQDFPSSDKGQEDSEPEAEPDGEYESKATCPAEPPEGKELPGADSTLPEELPSEEAESQAPEPRRRVFVVDLAPKGRLDVEAKPQLEGKVSLEVVTVGNAKLRSGEKTSKGGHHRAGRRSSMDWDGSGGGDSEIEEGEIVQPEDERYSPIRLFRSRLRTAEQRTLRVVEGDDFLSLHADSDDEGALQIDFSENQPDPRWKGVDLRRKILTQRRERYHRAPSPLPPPPPPPAPKRPASKSHSGSSSGSCKKSKRERKRSRERKASKPKESYTSSWNPKKKSKSRSKSKERRQSRHRASRSHSHHRTSRSWSPSISTSLSAVGSSHTSAERRKSRKSKSKEKRRGRHSRSRSSSRAHRSRHKDRHRGDGGRKKKKRSRSRSREKHSSHRLSKDKEREVHLLEEPKTEKALIERRRDARTVVPPSIQDLNDNDLFTIKRTITVNQQEKMEGLLGTPERAKREVLYDSEGMSFDACFSDREPAEESKSSGVRLTAKEDAPSRKDKRPEEDTKQKMPKEKERKRAYLEDRPGARDKYKKKLKEVPPCSEQQELPKAEKKARTDRDKTGKKVKAGGHKESGKLGSGRKVKLQSKVAVLIREGVSSTTSVKEVGSIGVKFSRDKESRSPFLKSEEKVLMVGASAAGQGEMADVKEPGFKPKKVKGLKAKMGVKKLKGIKPKGTSEPKKKKKLKVKTGLKKSKADSCSQGASSPLRVKEEPSWSGSEKSEGTAKPPSPQPLVPDQELTPDSQTVDSSCKTPDVSFLPEDPPVEQPRVPAEEPEADSLSETKEEQPLQQPSHTPRSTPQPPPAPMSWNLQGGVDCTSGVLALTALLFKMEEANLASRAKAQELIQATNQILTHTKPSASLNPPQPPAPPTHPPASHLAVPPVSYLLQGSLPLGGCGSTPGTPTGVLPGNLSQTSSGPPSAGIFASSSATDLGSTSSDGRGDSDKYLKKLHTQERAVEEVKLAIKPYYQKKEITKEEYKDILRKAVHKICHSKSGEINPVKVNNLIKAYVQRYKYFRKHGRKMDEEPCPPKEIGLDKSGLPMPPL